VTGAELIKALTSASAADDAAITGLRDVVGALGDTDYRLIGGMAVTLHLTRTLRAYLSRWAAVRPLTMTSR
jgi:hypothetical protein